MDLLETVGKNFDVNFVMKEFPADKQFTIWSINLDQRDLIDKKQKHTRRVITEEKLGDIGGPDLNTRQENQ
jgi:hypothetical protein